MGCRWDEFAFFQFEVKPNARRSIVIARDLAEGHTIVEADITYKRPGTGVSPLHWDEVIGMRTKRSMLEDDVMTWDDLVR